MNNTEESSPKEKLQFFAGEDLTEPFTQEQFEDKWKEYLLRLEERPNLRATLSRTPQLFGQSKLLLKIDNSAQEEEIAKIKPDLVSFLRKELRNTALELVTQIETQQIERMAYSESEKLELLTSKNPALVLLRQKFNLDYGS